MSVLGWTWLAFPGWAVPAGKTRTTRNTPTPPQFLEDESGECCSRILQADGHMEYGEVGFPDNPLHTHSDILSSSLRPEEALN